VASYTIPQDDRDGGSRRLFDMVCFLREAGWAVDYVAASRLGEDRYVRVMQRIGVAVHDDSRRPARAGEPARSDVVDPLVRTAAFDIALLAFWPVAELYLPVIRRHSPQTRVLVDSVDLHFLREARHSLSPTAEAGAASLLDDDSGSRFVGELNTYASADAVLTVSEKEAAILRDYTGDARLPRVVPLCEEMEPSTLPPAGRSGILFLGSFQHRPNVEGLKFFCKDIIPRLDPELLARHPILVVGNGLDDAVRRITDGVASVRCVGWVPSVVPYFRAVRLSVVPLLHGAGTKQKLVQALMAGTPTVTTSIGAEGLDLKDGEHVLIADDPGAFARGVERLLRDDRLCQDLATRGRAHVGAAHGRAVVRDRLLRTVGDVLAGPVKPAMLPDSPRERYETRMARAYYSGIATRVRALVAVAPQGGTLLIATGGSAEFLKLDGYTPWHFPRAADGERRADSFADGTAAVNHLEALRSDGADWLLVPVHSAWMLEHYPELRAHLDARYQLAGREEGVGVLYDLRERVRQGHRSEGLNGRVSPEANGALPAGRVSGNGAVHDLGPAHRPAEPPVKLIAFYLPQFHPIPENDRWWGEGFTEWRNVVKARPLFPGHHQPQLPTDLGFYDLRCPETRQEQADLARRYGIHGFCYYHYWFNGKRLLERPFNEVLRSGEPDLPFCLCWANEPWSRRWDGSESDVLQPQSYGPDDDRNHIRWLLGAIADPRAIAIDGRPVFLVYRTDQLPDPARTTDVWREEVGRAGLKGLYLIAVETGWDAGWDATKVGFDAKLLFQPQFSILGTVARTDVANPRLRVFDYQKAWPVLAHPDPVSYPRYDSVFPSWDNTPRKGEEGWVVHNSTPEAYEAWLRLAVERAMARPADQRVVFVNAWNEWAEGTHLEPDRTHGRAYLDATRRALSAPGRSRRRTSDDRRTAQLVGAGGREPR
jgi:glycosyltransferase involved in cell wall biosynthesis